MASDSFSLHDVESWQAYYRAWRLDFQGFREWYVDSETVMSALEKFVTVFRQKVDDFSQTHAIFYRGFFDLV